MPQVRVSEGALYDIGDAIREKLGVDTTYLPSEMAAAVASITSGGNLYGPTIETSGIDERYVMSGTGVICTIDGVAFEKVNNGDAFVAYYHASNNHVGPILVSETQSAVTYTSASGTNTSDGTVQYDDKTWYYAGSSGRRYASSGTFYNTDGPALRLDDGITSTSAAALALLEVANNGIETETVTITQNGTQAAPDGYDGYANGFMVDVPTDETLTASDNGKVVVATEHPSSTPLDALLSYSALTLTYGGTNADIYTVGTYQYAPAVASGEQDATTFAVIGLGNDGTGSSTQALSVGDTYFLHFKIQASGTFAQSGQFGYAISDDTPTDTTYTPTVQYALDADTSEHEHLVAFVATAARMSFILDASALPQGTASISEFYVAAVDQSLTTYSLASQTSKSITANGTYDTTTNDEVVVSVSGGSALTSADYGKAVAGVTSSSDALTVLDTSGGNMSNGTHSSTFKVMNVTGVTAGSRDYEYYYIGLGSDSGSTAQPLTVGSTYYVHFEVQVTGTFESGVDFGYGFMSDNPYSNSVEIRYMLDKDTSLHEHVAQFTATADVVNLVFDCSALTNGSSISFTNVYVTSALSGVGLVNQSSISATRNGTYDTTMNDEVDVHVVQYIGQTEDAVNETALTFTPNSNASLAKNAGCLLTVNNNVVVSKIMVWARSSPVSARISRADDNLTVASVTSASVSTDQWVALDLPNDVTLIGGNDYVVWYYHDDGTAAKHTSSSTNNTPYVSYKSGVYASGSGGNTPDTYESNTRYGADIYIKSAIAFSTFSLDSKQISSNGTYLASGDGLDGYDSVTVNVPTVTAADEGKVVVVSGGTVTKLPVMEGYACSTNVSVNFDNGSPIYTEATLTATVSSSAEHSLVAFCIGDSGIALSNAPDELTVGTTYYLHFKVQVTGTFDSSKPFGYEISSAVPSSTYDPSSDYTLDKDTSLHEHTQQFVATAARMCVNVDLRSIASGGSVAFTEVYVSTSSGAATYQLAAQTSRSIATNGTYDTTTNDEVVVNVSGGGGSIYDETQEGQYILDFTPDRSANAARSTGFLFASSKMILVSKIRVFARSSPVNAYISDSWGRTVTSVTNASVTAGQWNDIELSSPVILNPTEQYMVWACHADGTAMKYEGTGPTSQISYIVCNGTRYSTTVDTLPEYSEMGTTYGVDLYVDAYLTVRQAVLTTKTINQNGTYSASSDSADGYSSVTVNVSGVETVQESAWEALTTAQKQAHGLVAIVESSSGYVRGTLVSGADYTE